MKLRSEHLDNTSHSSALPDSRTRLTRKAARITQSWPVLLRSTIAPQPSARGAGFRASGTPQIVHYLTTNAAPQWLETRSSLTGRVVLRTHFAYRTPQILLSHGPGEDRRNFWAENMSVPRKPSPDILTRPASPRWPGMLSLPTRNSRSADDVFVPVRSDKWSVLTTRQ